MGLWEFLRQWRPSRVAVGVAASIFLHLALVAIVLWGPKLVPRKWDVKKGDSIIVELPKPDEPAPRGVPSAPPAPAAPPARPAPPAPPAPPVAAPKPSPPAPAAPRPAPESRVASAPRPPAPTPPAPKAAEPAPSVPKGTEPAPAPAEPPAKAAEPTPSPAPSAPAAPSRPSPEQQVASVPQPSAPQAPPAPDMRTALRRGAGGTGLAGRGGIEGDPIPLDSDNPRFNDYLEQLRRRIQEKWVYPCIKAGQNCEYREATLEIEFGILKNGQLQFIEVVRKSDYEVYDESAAIAIKLASPFPPLPPIMLSAAKPGSPGVPIRARFVYLIVKSSLTNLLH